MKKGEDSRKSKDSVLSNENELKIFDLISLRAKSCKINLKFINQTKKYIYF